MNTTAPGACLWCLCPKKLQNTSGISVEKSWSRVAGCLQTCELLTHELFNPEFMCSLCHWIIFFSCWFGFHTQRSLCVRSEGEVVEGGEMKRVFPSCRHCSGFLGRSLTAVVSQLWCCSWIAVSWQCRSQRKVFYLIFLCNAALDLKSVFAMIEECLLGSWNLCGNI